MVLRHPSITTTGNVYVQEIAKSTVRAINARTRAVLSARDGFDTTLGSESGRKGGEHEPEQMLKIGLETQRAPTGSSLRIDTL